MTRPESINSLLRLDGGISRRSVDWLSRPESKGWRIAYGFQWRGFPLLALTKKGDQDHRAAVAIAGQSTATLLYSWEIEQVKTPTRTMVMTVIASFVQAAHPATDELESALLKSGERKIPYGLE